MNREKWRTSIFRPVEMGRVACLNVGAQNDVGTLTPSVSDLLKYRNEEFPTTIYAQILYTVRAEWH